MPPRHSPSDQRILASLYYRTTLEEELERHQELKQAYEIVSKEMDTKIAELESRKGQSLR